jgi:hypothetical protein
VHADKEPEPLNLGVPVVNFPRANTFLARARALLWVRDWVVIGCLVVQSQPRPQAPTQTRGFRPLSYTYISGDRALDENV